LAVVGCVGGTDPATNVTNLSAKLNAHGFTNNGPATWWWEYDTVKSDLGTANDTEVCGNPPEADSRCGPAAGGSPGSQVPLSVTVTGLTPNTTYYFRACAKDQNASQAVCAGTLSFKTLAGTAYAFDRKWGSLGTGNGQFDIPTGVATDSAGNVYVSDTGNDRVQKFTGQGAFITKWGTPGTGDGQFASPGGLTTDSAANVYVVDRYRFDGNRIQKFNSSGTFITKWGAHSVEPGGSSALTDVAADPSGNVYATDHPVHFADSVQKFSSTGSFLTTWGFPGGSIAPSAIATDASSNVYVADAFYARVQKFSSTGTLLTTWGSQGTGDGQFSLIIGLGTDSAGAVYTIDLPAGSYRPRIQKFTPTGTFITKFGSEGSGDGQFEQLRAVAVGPFGGVYVAEATDNGLHRIQRFKPVR
jgi:DNA-binding beta-propeller fold protein YncE